MTDRSSDTTLKLVLLAIPTKILFVIFTNIYIVFRKFYYVVVLFEFITLVKYLGPPRLSVLCSCRIHLHQIIFCACDSREVSSRQDSKTTTFLTVDYHCTALYRVLVDVIVVIKYSSYY